MISQREIRKILKKHWKGSVSRKGIVILKDLCKEAIDKLIEDAVIDFAEYNRYRQIQGLPKLRRFSGKSISMSGLKLFKSASRNNDGARGQNNRDTLARNIRKLDR